MKTLYVVACAFAFGTFSHTASAELSIDGEINAIAANIIDQKPNLCNIYTDNKDDCDIPMNRACAAGCPSVSCTYIFDNGVHNPGTITKIC